MDDPPSPWEHSKAKKLLYKDLVDGIVTADMKPKQVYDMRREFQQYQLKNFRNNLKTLREDLTRKIESAAFDSQALAKDREIFPRSEFAAGGYPRWDGSEAQQLFLHDFEHGKHTEMKPAELHQTRQAYLLFPLDVFRNHIYQEKREKLESPYWLNKKAAKEEEKQQKIERRKVKARKKAVAAPAPAQQN
jgi:hypothetical protein